jgi:hypothetical protein
MNSNKGFINKKDDKSCHKFKNKFKSINKTNNNVFKCHFNGCRKIFLNKNLFINHKNRHLMRNQNRIE